MRFQYKFRLNDEPLFATMGATVVDKLEEALDEGVLNIPITVLNYEYKMFGLLQITSKDLTVTPNLEKTFNYLILSDTVNIISKNGYFSHDIKAVEYTHKLDKYLVNALTFTRPKEKTFRAPFDYNDSGLPLGVAIKAYIPKIHVQNTYILGEEYTFKQVGQGRYYNGTSPNYLVNIGIQFTLTTEQNLTNGDVVHTFTQKGFNNVVIGIYDNDGLFRQVYSYLVNVVDDKRYTLYDMIQRVRAVVPIESKYFFDTTRIFNLDESLVEPYKKIEMPQMFFQNMTARQILNTLFKYINSISRLKYVADGVDTLTIDEFNKITGLFGMKDIVDFSSSQDIQQYATKALVYLEQGLQTNFRDNPSIKTPSKDRFKTVRASNIQLTRDRFLLPLEEPIYEISKIEVMLPKVRVTQSVSGGSNTEIFSDYVLDLTPRLIEKREWELKKITENYPNYDEILSFALGVGRRLNRGGNFYWERNKTSIDLSILIGDAIRNNIIFEVIQEALNEEITLNPIFFTTPYFGNLYFDRQNITYLTAFETNPEDNYYRGLKFNVEYITLQNPIIQVDRSDISNINYDTQLKINQNSRLSDVGRMSRDAYGQLQRASVPNQTFTKVHTDFSDILDVGMIDSNNYIIVKRALSFYNDYILGTYEKTLDHNRLEEFTGINQEYRVFEIARSEQVYNRIDFYNDYFIIDKPTTSSTYTSATQPTFLKSTLTNAILDRLLKKQTTEYKVTYSFVRTDGLVEVFPDVIQSGQDTQYHFIMTPVNSSGGKNTLIFYFGFSNNQVAGDALINEKDTADTLLFNDPIRYTDLNGFFDEFWFSLGTAYQATTPFDLILKIGMADIDPYFNQEYKYPLVKATDTQITNQNFIAQAGHHDLDNVSYNPIISYKDASSNYYVSYQINIVSQDERKYIIGHNFSIDNPLVKNQNVKDGINYSKPLFLYKYKDETTYNIFDDLTIKLQGKTSGVDYDKVEINTSTASYNSTTGLYRFIGSGIVSNTTHTSWAIGDEDGNLYLACNQPYNGFNVILRHHRPNLLQIGNK